MIVTKLCFKCGMYKQGLLHDLSKYSPSEFLPSVKYYQGNRSPISREKELLGYSECWLHHKGRNKHHWEYWTDRIDNSLVSLEMPTPYLLECVLDKIAASKVYQKQNYNTGYPLHFFSNSKEVKIMHPNNSKRIIYYLTYLKDKGEDKTLQLIKKDYKEYKKAC